MSYDDLQVLRHFRSDTPQPDAETRRRIYETATRGAASRRHPLVALLAALGAAAAAVALTGLAVLPGGDSSSVARAATALSPSGETILHTVVVTSRVDPDGSVSSATTEAWRRNTPPYDERSIEGRGTRRREQATAAGRPQYYDVRTNTIHTMPAAAALPGRSGAPESSPVNRLVRALANARGSADLVPTLRGLLSSGQAHEDRRVSAGGREAIRIAFAGTTVTLLVDAGTYEPVEWTVVADDGTRLTSRFETYELLPATSANLALLSLTAQHPEASVEADLQAEGSEEVAPGLPLRDR